MNTIPTTLNDRPVPYTVVGGPAARACSEGNSVSVLLLGRGSRLYRNEALRDLERFGFDSIVSVEEGGDAVDMESLSSPSFFCLFFFFCCFSALERHVERGERTPARSERAVRRWEREETGGSSSSLFED